MVEFVRNNVSSISERSPQVALPHFVDDHVTLLSPTQQRTREDRVSRPLSPSQKNVDVVYERLVGADFQNEIRNYQLSPRNKISETLISQLQTLYSRIYQQWPWDEMHKPNEVILDLNIALSPTSHHKPFCHIAKKDGKLVGAILGVTTDIKHAALWLTSRKMLFTERSQFKYDLVKAREEAMKKGLLGFADPKLVIIRDFLISDSTEQEDGTTSFNARGKGKVAMQLLYNMISNARAEGFSNYIAYTVRKKSGQPGRQPPMYNITLALDGKELMTIGDLPADPTLELVIVGGSLENAYWKFQEYGLANFERLLFHEARQHERQRRSHIH